MTKKYRLLKDTPRTKAGTIFFKKDSDSFYRDIVCPMWEYFHEDTVHGQPAWFEEIKEPEFKIMSPAVININWQYPNNVQLLEIGSTLYESASMASSSQGDAFYAWPACDGEGKPIQYKVPVGFEK